MLPVNMVSSSPIASSFSQTQNTPEPRKGVAATQPSSPAQDVVKSISKPVEQSSGVQSADLPIQMGDVSVQQSEWNVSDAADELAEVRAQAARLTDELQAKGLLGTQETERNESMIGKQAENAFAATRSLEAAAAGSNKIKVL